MNDPKNYNSLVASVLPDWSRGLVLQRTWAEDMPPMGRGEGRDHLTPLGPRFGVPNRESQ